MRPDVGWGARDGFERHPRGQSHLLSVTLRVCVMGVSQGGKGEPGISPSRGRCWRMVGFVSPEVWGEWGRKCRFEWWEPGGMTEDPGRVNVRWEGAEEERDGTGVEGRVPGRPQRQVI